MSGSKKEQRMSSNLIQVWKIIDLKSKVPYIISLSVSTIALIATFVVSGLANYHDPRKFGFDNTTGDISDMYYTHITPSGWGFSIWGVIYAWQGLWTIYGWSLVIRPSLPIIISPSSLIFYVYANISNITWLYLWGNGFPQCAFPSAVLIGVFLYTAIGYQAVFLYWKTTIVEELQNYKVDLYLTRILVLNGIAVYATWITVATLLNFTVVLDYYADMSSADAGTVGLSLLAVEIIVYFTLENTILDLYVRPVVMVYPVVIWALSAVIDAHWGDDDEERTNIFALILLILSIILFVARIILVVAFCYLRPRS